MCGSACVEDGLVGGYGGKRVYVCGRGGGGVVFQSVTIIFRWKLKWRHVTREETLLDGSTVMERTFLLLLLR